MLEEQGKAVWVDWDDIPPASEWERDLEEGVLNCDALVFVISPGAAASQHCLRELTFADERNKRVLPVKHRAVADADLPPAVRTRNWIPSEGSFEDDFDGCLARLLQALDTDLDWVRSHTHWGARAEEWDGKERDASLLLRGRELSSAEDFLAQAQGKDPAPTALHSDFVVRSRRAATRRQRTILLSALAALAVSIALGAVALLQRNEAVDQRNTAQSRQVAAVSLNLLDSDPRAALILAREALARRRTPDAVYALRRALVAPNVTALLDGPEGRIVSSAFSPDGKRAATAGDDRVVRIWDTATAREIAATTRFQVIATSVAFSPDGQTVGITGADGIARIVEAKGANQLAGVGSPGGEQLRAIAFAPDGLTVAIGGTEGKVRIWNPVGPRLVAELDGHRAQVLSLAFSPDGNSLVSGAEDGTARVWNVAAGTARRVLEIPRRAVTDPNRPLGVLTVAYSVDGERILTASNLGGVHVWKAQNGRMLRGFADTGSAATGTGALSPQGDMVLVAQGTTARVYDYESRRTLVELKGHEDVIVTARFGPDGRTVMTSGQDGTARIWDLGLAVPTRWYRKGGALTTAALAPDGRTLVTAGAGAALIWRVADGRILHTLKGLGDPITSVRFSPDSRLVAIAEPTARTRVWDVATGTARGDAWRLGGVTAVDFTPRGDRLITGGGDGTIRASDLRDGATTREAAATGVGISDVAVRPGGAAVASAGDDGNAQVWDLATGAEQARFALGRDVGASLFGLGWSADGRLLALAGADGSARVWEPARDRQVVVIGAHGAEVQTAVLSRDGGTLLTTSADGTARVWETATGRPIATIASGRGEVVDGGFSPDERSLMSATIDGEARITPCPACTASLDELLRLSDEREVGGLSPDQRRRAAQEG